ncbi:DUF4268 domain-containing protein [Kribbella karoonensis]|uniref:DUF4268 domain-containing protein n=1 Tax=Kribbella karoonensis TaxID=324851 RepID=A0ABN2EGM3_9ACTN
MTQPLGRLTAVPAREVWPHEAHDFTPWLLANVDVLSDLLGMDLVLDLAEHPVGDFSLDLLGRDEATGRTVIVENQLEGSDHAHLGQILTYAAGTNPGTIVWVTSGFRPEHRAALDWLNEHTDEDTRFFGVEIDVVRIGDSAPAPAFKLVAQPNDWEKQVKSATAAATGTMTDRDRLYWDFWEQTRTAIQARHPGWSRARSSTKASWFNMALGTSGAVVSMSFTRAGLCVQLYFEAPDAAANQARYDALLARRDEFDAALGESATWDPMPGRKAARIVVYSEFVDVAYTVAWPAMTEWLIESQGRLRAAIDAVGGIPAV